MKNLKNITLGLIWILCCNTIGAYDFKVKGIYYNIKSNNKVEVTKDKEYSYSGNITIPTNVSYNGINYKVASIGEAAFERCAVTGSLVIPNSVTTIESWAFNICSGFTGTLTISNSVQSIGYRAFSYCTGFTGPLTIPNSVTYIGNWAFENCEGFSGTLTIPNSVKSIGDGAFNCLRNISTVVSEIQSPFSVSEFTFGGLSSDAVLKVPKGTKSKYEAFSGWTKHFKEIIEIGGTDTYILSIKATGNGSASYNGTMVRGKTTSFTVNEGTSATITFTPDNGYRIKSVKVNNSTVSVSNNQYTISSINANTTVEVEFEAVASTEATLTVKASGKGQVQLGMIVIRNGTNTFIVNEGDTEELLITSDTGYRVKSLLVNSEEYSSGQSNIRLHVKCGKTTNVEVTFEAIPPTYSLSIKSTGNGSVSYDGNLIRNNTSSFTVDKGTSAIISISADNGYRIKAVKVNSSDVTSSVSNNQYTVSNIQSNTTVEVEFEAIPPTTYTLSISSIGSGYASYDGTTIRSKTSTFTINEGANATISFNPDNGYRIKTVKVNSSDVTSRVSNNQYTVSNIQSSTTVSVEFEAIPVTTYTLLITASGNGSASYSGTTVRNSTKKFTLNEGISATISFNPDNGYQIKSATMNGREIADLSTMSFTIDIMDEDVSIEVEFEAIPPTTYTLTLKSSGNGSVSYNGTVVRNTTKSFTLNKGISATISFSSDKGYRIKKATMNGKEIADLSKMSFTIDNVDEDVTIEVEFEAIPPTTYTLSITSSGVGSATYNSTVVRGKTTSFTVNEGTNATISFTPDIGYRIKSVMVNSTDVTSSVSNGQYTVRNIKANTTVEVIFEAIPKTYTLSIKATGNGTASYGGTMIKNETKSFTLTEGVSATITFSPDNDHRIKSATMNGKEIADLSTMSFTIDFMDEDVSIVVEFEAIPFYSLTYVVDGETYKSYQVMEGAIITPEAEPTKEGYTFSGWSEIPETMPDHDVTITGSFTKNKPDINSLDKAFTIDGINYEMVSTDNQTVVVAEGDYGKILEVPANIMYGEYDWDVIGLKDDALDKCEELAAIIWNPLAMFTARVKNPNLLLYVHDQTNASYGVNNVIVNGIAESIELTDATSGNDFYCPRAFRAKKIIYSHNYKMETGLGESKGWETIVLPFDVQNYTHATKGDIEPFTTWTMDSNKKPFWLFELTADGYMDVPGIKANTPYIISMPNNRQYEQQYQISGVVTFSATNVEVKESDDLKSISYQNRKFIPNYTNQKNLDYLPLNVNNNYVTYEGADAGSKFIGGLRSVHPFEAYMITTDGTRSIDVFDGMTTAINDIYMRIESAETMKVYNTKGVLIKTVTTNEDLRRGLPAGVYIVNGKKMIIK